MDQEPEQVHVQEQPSDPEPARAGGDPSGGQPAEDAGALFAQAIGLRAEAERELAEAVAGRREALREAEATVAEARDVAARLRESARTGAEEETLQARERAAGILVGAREEAEKQVSEARLEATRVQEEALAQAERVREEARVEAAETADRLRHEAEAEVARAFGEVRALVADRAQALEKNLGSLQATLARAELSLDHVWVLAGSTVLAPRTDPSAGSDGVDGVDVEEEPTAGGADVEADGTTEDEDEAELSGATHATEAAAGSRGTGQGEVFGERRTPVGAKPLSWLFRST